MGCFRNFLEKSLFISRKHLLKHAISSSFTVGLDRLEWSGLPRGAFPPKIMSNALDGTNVRPKN